MHSQLIFYGFCFCSFVLLSAVPAFFDWVTRFSFESCLILDVIDMSVLGPPRAGRSWLRAGSRLRLFPMANERIYKALE